MSAVCDCLFNLFAATLHIGGIFKFLFIKCLLKHVDYYLLLLLLFIIYYYYLLLLLFIIIIIIIIIYYYLPIQH